MLGSKKIGKTIFKTVAAALTVSFLTLCIAFGACSDRSPQDSSLSDDYQPIILENAERVKNVILLIGDGMGQNQIRAGELYKKKRLYMQDFPYCVNVETRSLSGITDSAAAGTALATGVRTKNGLVGVNSDGLELQTIVDIAKGAGKRTAIISTEELYGATPMAFSAHSESRTASVSLLESATATSNVDMFLGYTLTSAYQSAFRESSYNRISNVDELSEQTEEGIYGLYNIQASAAFEAEEGEVAFSRLIYEALEYLSRGDDGFFLMAEGAHIDHGGHENDMAYMLRELVAFDEGVRIALEWAKGRDDTVVIVTADHETGRLHLQSGVNEDNLFSTYTTDGGLTYKPRYYSWGTDGHSDQDVSCYINGANVDFAEYSSLNSSVRIKNTDIFYIMKDLLTE